MTRNSKTGFLKDVRNIQLLEPHACIQYVAIITMRNSYLMRYSKMCTIYIFTSGVGLRDRFQVNYSLANVYGKLEIAKNKSTHLFLMIEK